MKYLKMFEDFNNKVYPEGYLKVKEEDIYPGNILKVDGYSIKIIAVQGKGIGSVVMARYLDGSKKGSVDAISINRLEN